ncbi:uncharacterized protein CLUP02_08389 [Colletotrichum lupini]|uniref:NADH dehydrogenase [ubiquinone] 1 beta subcomplex subunit 2 n=13 Tax=Colletotrichum TaxID=5455 RepID=A0A9Q8WGV6_9PEZI|nr:uncharacterized protein CLUP02_08389 [Colletotrichum lupini]UQC82899.1 hypothetical protein CLUP02_08389 [Colletotrichum lupini]
MEHESLTSKDLSDCQSVNDVSSYGTDERPSLSEFPDLVSQQSLERLEAKANPRIPPSIPLPRESSRNDAPGVSTFAMYTGPKPPTPHVPGVYRFTATALGAGMWFFLMYRAKKDGAVLLGWKHPWDH